MNRVINNIIEIIVGAAAPIIGGKCSISAIGPNIWFNMKNENPNIAPSISLIIRADDLFDPILSGTDNNISTINDIGWNTSCQNFSDSPVLVAGLSESINLVNSVKFK